MSPDGYLKSSFWIIACCSWRHLRTCFLFEKSNLRIEHDREAFNTTESTLVMSLTRSNVNFNADNLVTEEIPCCVRYHCSENEQKFGSRDPDVVIMELFGFYFGVWAWWWSADGYQTLLYSSRSLKLPFHLIIESLAIPSATVECQCHLLHSEWKNNRTSGVREWKQTALYSRHYLGGGYLSNLSAILFR